MFLEIPQKSLAKPNVNMEHKLCTFVPRCNIPTFHPLSIIFSLQELQKHKRTVFLKKQYLLKEVGVVLEAEKGHCVGQHPYVAAPAIVVRLAPLAVFIPDAQDLVRYSVGVGTLVVGVGVVT